MVVDELNTLIGHRTQSIPFWKTDLKAQLRDKYGVEAITDAEMAADFHLAMALLLSASDASKVVGPPPTSQTLGAVARTQVSDEWDSRDVYLRLTIARIQAQLGMSLRADVRFDGMPPRALSSLLPSYVDPDSVRVKHSSTRQFCCPIWSLTSREQTLSITMTE